jgi:hypothetical protein
MRAPHPVGGPVPELPWQLAAYGLGLMCGTRESSERYIGHTGAGPGRAAAIYQAASDGDNGQDHCTVAVFPPLDALGLLTDMQLPSLTRIAFPKRPRRYWATWLLRATIQRRS